MCLHRSFSHNLYTTVISYMYITISFLEWKPINVYYIPMLWLECIWRMRSHITIINIGLQCEKTILYLLTGFYLRVYDHGLMQIFLSIKGKYCPMKKGWVDKISPNYAANKCTIILVISKKMVFAIWTLSFNRNWSFESLRNKVFYFLKVNNNLNIFQNIENWLDF